MSFPIQRSDAGVFPKRRGGDTTGEVKEDIAASVEVETEDYDYLAGVALSRLGIVPAEFYELTPIEFDYAIRDYDSREKARVEILVRNNSEMIRWQTMHLLNPHLKKGSKIKDPKRLGRFPWDPEPKPMSLEQWRAALYAIAKTPYKKKS